MGHKQVFFLCMANMGCAKVESLGTAAMLLHEG